MRLFFSFAAILPAAALSGAEIQTPAIHDPDLQLELVAAEPDLVTPTGAAVDKRGRVFVIESHTHFPPKDYPGPKTDRVKIFEHNPATGKSGAPKIFAEGLDRAMSLAFSPQGELYLAHRNGVVILRDRNRDGVSESRAAVLQLHTAEVYPHNAVSGLAFSADGWLYVGMGENLGKSFTLAGADGSQLSGGGEGGHVFRCRPDGSKLQHIATGLWNPFGLEFDRAGNLFAVDNDPGGRPPCRLLHIVEGGDYGFQYRLGRDGQHVFQAWNGELAGTLPMVAGTGEAPCGILLANRAKLSAHYRDAFLVTSWGDHFIELYRPQPQGASFRATREILIQGGPLFRPVAIAPAPDGSIYITDWVDVSYPVHGQGRLWRLSARPGASAAVNAQIPRPAVPPATARLRELLNANSPKQLGVVLAGLTNADPFIRSAATHALARPVFRDAALAALNDRNPQARVGAILALRRAKLENPTPLARKLLTDPAEEVRFNALRWVGEDGLLALEKNLDSVFSIGTPSANIFDAYLAAADLLAASQTNGAPAPAKAAERTRAGRVERIFLDESKPARLRALAAAQLPAKPDKRVLEALLRLAEGDELALRFEAVRTLAEVPDPRAALALMGVAWDRNVSPTLRAEAVLGVARGGSPALADLAGLLDDREPVVQAETARALRGAADNPVVRAALRKKLFPVNGGPPPAALAEQLDFALRLFTPAHESPRSIPVRPATREAWAGAVARGGDSESGRRVFFHPLVNCAKCHRVQGRGGVAGPDLSAIGRAADRRKLIESILEPSREIAPQFEHHIVETKDGQTIAGTWVNVRLDGTLILNTADAGQMTIPGKDIATRQTAKLSLMPEGLEQAMTVRDLRDLLAFLESCK